nr:ADP-ribosylation factor-like protein 15a isoform X3 [Nothobranchius furzeri]
MDYLILASLPDVEILSHHTVSSEWKQASGRTDRLLLNQCFRALCCKGPPPPRPEYDVVCIGLTGAGKTSLLSRLCSEGGDGIVPTTGFSIKAVPFPNAILNVKELGGADNIKKYWSRYYQGSQGVVFVLDSASSDEDLEAARNELHSALQHPQLCTLPFLILANHQDKPAARTPSQEFSPDKCSCRCVVQHRNPSGRLLSFISENEKCKKLWPGQTANEITVNYKQIET